MSLKEKSIEDIGSFKSSVSTFCKGANATVLTTVSHRSHVIKKNKDKVTSSEVKGGSMSMDKLNSNFVKFNTQQKKEKNKSDYKTLGDIRYQLLAKLLKEVGLVKDDVDLDKNTEVEANIKKEVVSERLKEFAKEDGGREKLLAAKNAFSNALKNDVFTQPRGAFPSKTAKKLRAWEAEATKLLAELDKKDSLDNHAELNSRTSDVEPREYGSSMFELEPRNSSFKM